MANHLASEGLVQVGSSTVAELKSYSLDESSEMVDASIMTSASKVNKAGVKSWNGNAECFWDETDTSGQGALTNGSEVTIKFMFEGNTSGDTYKTGTAIVESLSTSGATDGIVEASFSFQGTGDLTTATV